MKRPTRAASRKMWARVAAGDLDDAEVRAWVVGVAAAVLAADDTADRPDGKDRVAAIMRAVGLNGRKKDTAELRAAIRMFKDLMELGGGMPDLDTGVRLTPKQSVRVVVANWVGVDPRDLKRPMVREAIDQRIRDAMKDAD